MAETHMWRLWERQPFRCFEEGFADFGAQVLKTMDCWRFRDAGTHTLSIVSATRACASGTRIDRPFCAKLRAKREHSVRAQLYADGTRGECGRLHNTLP